MEMDTAIPAAIKYGNEKEADNRNGYGIRFIAILFTGSYPINPLNENKNRGIFPPFFCFSLLSHNAPCRD